MFVQLKKDVPTEDCKDIIESLRNQLIDLISAADSSTHHIVVVSSITHCIGIREGLNPPLPPAPNETTEFL